MPTALENKCCGKMAGRCVTISEAFNDICLNTNVLGVRMAIREDYWPKNRTDQRSITGVMHTVGMFTGSLTD